MNNFVLSAGGRPAEVSQFWKELGVNFFQNGEDTRSPPMKTAQTAEQVPQKEADEGIKDLGEETREQPQSVRSQDLADQGAAATAAKRGNREGQDAEPASAEGLSEFAEPPSQKVCPEVAAAEVIEADDATDQEEAQIGHRESPGSDTTDSAQKTAGVANTGSQKLPQFQSGLGIAGQQPFLAIQDNAEETVKAKADNAIQYQIGTPRHQPQDQLKPVEEALEDICADRALDPALAQESVEAKNEARGWSEGVCVAPGALKPEEPDASQAWQHTKRKKCNVSPFVPGATQWMGPGTTGAHFFPTAAEEQECSDGEAKDTDDTTDEEKDDTTDQSEDGDHSPHTVCTTSGEFLGTLGGKRATPAAQEVLKERSPQEEKTESEIEKEIEEEKFRSSIKYVKASEEAEHRKRYQPFQIKGGVASKPLPNDAADLSLAGYQAPAWSAQGASESLGTKGKQQRAKKTPAQISPAVSGENGPFADAAATTQESLTGLDTDIIKILARLHNGLLSQEQAYKQTTAAMKAHGKL